jgi:hypothetical protein
MLSYRLRLRGLVRRERHGRDWCLPERFADALTG